MTKLNLKYYTSYYANFRNIPKDYLCVAISRFVPEVFKSSNYINFLWNKDNFLAPSKQLLSEVKSGSINQEEYSKRYIQEVFNRCKPYTGYDNPSDWIQAFDNELVSQQTEWKAVVFMCYEKPSDFCHRQVLRKIFNKCYQIPIEELNLVKENKIKSTTALF